MEKHKLQYFTESERKFAEENHNLVYGFLHRYEYSIEEYYNIAAVGFLKAVQIYNRRKDLQEKYAFAFIAQQYMRLEIGNYFRMENSQKRKSNKDTISLDADYADAENFYNIVGGKSAEADVLEEEFLNDIMENLSDIQRKIAQLKMNGYNNREVYVMLRIPSSTFYKEMKRIKAIVENILTN